jgi:hypothetical protein
MCVVFVLWRILTLSSASGHMFGGGSLLSNLWVLASSFSEVARSPFVTAATLFAVWRLWSGWPGLWRLVLFPIAWALLAYAPFLLNRSYQSSTYLNLALLVPAAAIIEPAIAWFWSAERRPWIQRATPVVFVLLMNPADAKGRLQDPDRFDAALVDAIVQHVQARSEPQDVWVIELSQDATRMGQSMAADQISLEPMLDDSLAVSESVPGHVVHVHDVDPELFRYVRRRPDDLAIALWTDAGRTVLGVVPHDTTAPVPFYPTTPVQPPPAVPSEQSAPEGSPLVDQFWRAYAERKNDTMVSLVKQLDRNAPAGGPTSPAWVRAIHAAEPKAAPGG